MKRIFIATIFLFAAQLVHAQDSARERLKALMLTSTNDSIKIVYLDNLFINYLWDYPDSSLPYVQEQISLAQKMKSDIILARAYYDYCWFYLIIGDYPKAISAIQQSLNLAERSHSAFDIANAHDLLSVVYFDEGEYKQAISHTKIAKSIFDPILKDYLAGKNIDTGHFGYFPVLWGLSQNYEKLNELDSAMSYMHLLHDLSLKRYGKIGWSIIPLGFGNVYSKLGNYPLALQYYREGIAIATNHKDFMDLYNAIAATYKNQERIDSSIFYANKVLELSKQTHYSIAQLSALNLLAEIYKSKNNSDSVAKYLELTVVARDTLFGRQKIVEIQTAAFDEQLRKQDEARQDEELKSKIRFYSVLAGLVGILVIASLLWRNNRHKQKANILLQQEKEKVESTLAELKSTQAQLIQSEKMASLGEMTAGIAHEIQNPLNFVNNFSEVNNELIEELNAERLRPNAGRDEKLENQILGNIKQNLEKINHHGKRADSIVKNMLQHSRTSTGQKEPTDINALADEYLRLSYHGLRAKDKTFNATIKTDFDHSIEKINIIPQDIGRVLLNLYNNAFYAVTEKKKQLGENYEPAVSVSTKKINDKIEIRVRDNGNGIPQKVQDKIFQPFFTTKPAGEGTGLGLSLAYDIIKAHGGEIKVETEEGEGTAFMVQLNI